MSIWIPRAFLCWFLGLLASLTVLTHAAQLFGWSFQLYARLGSGIVAIISLALAIGAARSIGSLRSDGVATLLSIALMLGAALMALFSFSSDADDYYYVVNAVHALANPEEPLGFAVHGLIPTTTAPIISFNFSVSLPFEYCQAILSHVFGIEYLTSYYFVMPMAVAAAIAAALLYCAGQFRLPPLELVMGCAVALLLLAAMGETHRAYGSFTVTRAFQGKTLLLMAGLPAAAGAAIEFFRRPSAGRWLLVATIATAMVGASASSIVLLPLLAPLLVAAISADRGWTLPPLRSLLGYAGAHFYLVVYAIVYLWSGAHHDLAASSPVNSAFPRDFAGHLWLVVDRELLLWPAIAAGAGLLFALLAEPRAKRMLGTWFALCVILYLNPPGAQLLIEHVTSSNIYWRLFYLLPIPLLVALAFGYALAWVRDRSGANASAAVACSLCLAALSLQWLVPGASIYKQASLGAPRYNVPGLELAAARELISYPLPKGPMLSPLELCGVIPMLASGYPQLVRRAAATPELIWLASEDDPVSLQRRLGATRFASGSLVGVGSFMRSLAITRFESIVLHRDAWRHLREQGFDRQVHDRGYGDPISIAGWIVLVRAQD